MKQYCFNQEVFDFILPLISFVSNRFEIDLIFLVKEGVAYIGLENVSHPQNFFLPISLCVCRRKMHLGSLRISPRYIVEGLAGGGSVAVAVGIINR